MRRSWMSFAVGLTMFVYGLVAQAASPDDPASVRSAPPDLTPYTRPAVPEDAAPQGVEAVLSGAFLPPQFVGLQIVDVVVDNTDHTLVFTDTFNDGETSIAINPSKIVKIGRAHV